MRPTDETNAPHGTDSRHELALDRSDARAALDALFETSGTFSRRPVDEDAAFFAAGDVAVGPFF